jgi:hypothetical protein
MSSNLTWIDRVRIERVVWFLDQRLYELPRRSRIAIRREVRGNLQAAAAEQGVRNAIRNMGSGAQLAADYLSAEFGEGPRHSWLAAALFLLTVPLVATSLFTDAALAYSDGLVAANSHVSGTFTWHGIRYLQEEVTYTFVDGKGDHVGGAWTPLLWMLWVVGFVLVGRLWRALPALRRRRAGSAVKAATGPQ